MIREKAISFESQDKNYITDCKLQITNYRRRQTLDCVSPIQGSTCDLEFGICKLEFGTWNRFL